MIRVLFVFIGNGVGVSGGWLRALIRAAEFHTDLTELGPGESFSRRQYHPRVVVRSGGFEVRPSGVKSRVGRKGKRFGGGNGEMWKGGVRLIGSNKVWVALRARARATHTRVSYI